MENALLHNNPMLKEPVRAVLAALRDAGVVDRGVFLESLEATWPESQSRTPSTVVDICVRNGLIREEVLVDGEPREGTLAEARADESLPEEAAISSLLRLAPAGAETLEATEPARLIRELFEGRPAYAPIFRAALDACAHEAGATRPQLEQALDAAIRFAGAAGRIYPQYFIDALETAGALFWEGGLWRASDAARAFAGEGLAPRADLADVAS